MGDAGCAMAHVLWPGAVLVGLGLLASALVARRWWTLWGVRRIAPWWVVLTQALFSAVQLVTALSGTSASVSAVARGGAAGGPPGPLDRRVIREIAGAGLRGTFMCVVMMPTVPRGAGAWGGARLGALRRALAIESSERLQQALVYGNLLLRLAVQTSLQVALTGDTTSAFVAVLIGLAQSMGAVGALRPAWILGLWSTALAQAVRKPQRRGSGHPAAARATSLRSALKGSTRRMRGAGLRAVTPSGAQRMTHVAAGETGTPGGARDEEPPRAATHPVALPDYRAQAVMLRRARTALYVLMAATGMVSLAGMDYDLQVVQSLALPLTLVGLGWCIHLAVVVSLLARSVESLRYERLLDKIQRRGASVDGEGRGHPGMRWRHTRSLAERGQDGDGGGGQVGGRVDVRVVGGGDSASENGGEPEGAPEKGGRGAAGWGRGGRFPRTLRASACGSDLRGGDARIPGTLRTLASGGPSDRGGGPGDRGGGPGDLGGGPGDRGGDLASPTTDSGHEPAVCSAERGAEAEVEG